MLLYFFYLSKEKDDEIVYSVSSSLLISYLFSCSSSGSKYLLGPAPYRLIQGAFDLVKVVHVCGGCILGEKIFIFDKWEDAEPIDQWQELIRKNR